MHRLARLSHQVAEAYGFECLTDRVADTRSGVRLRCAAGHAWEITVERLLRGPACPRCSRFRYSIDDMRALARKQGGTCRSRAYLGHLVKLEWRCREGHTWRATPNTILSGCWCPTCRLSMGSIEEMRALAMERGGTCLGEAYVNKETPLRWRCRKGHEWSAIPGHVKRGSWCPTCAGMIVTLRDMRRLAASHGGTCLSKRYLGTSRPLRWRCRKGHVFSKMPTYVKSGSWCPTCSSRQPGSIERMRRTARARGGRCLSREYAGSAIKLTWQCARGHRWQATPAHVVHGSWCPSCAGSAQPTLEDMQRLAARRGGRTLSKRYVKSRLPLDWECREGHRFAATPAAVVKGRWCLVCKRAGGAARR